MFWDKLSILDFYMLELSFTQIKNCIYIDVNWLNTTTTKQHMKCNGVKDTALFKVTLLINNFYFLMEGKHVKWLVLILLDL